MKRLLWLIWIGAGLTPLANAETITVDSVGTRTLCSHCTVNSVHVVSATRKDSFFELFDTDGSTDSSRQKFRVGSSFTDYNGPAVPVIGDLVISNQVGEAGGTPMVITIDFTPGQ